MLNNWKLLLLEIVMEGSINWCRRETVKKLRTKAQTKLKKNTKGNRQTFLRPVFHADLKQSLIVTQCWKHTAIVE